MESGIVGGSHFATCSEGGQTPNEGSTNDDRIPTSENGGTKKGQA